MLANGCRREVNQILFLLLEIFLNGNVLCYLLYCCFQINYIKLHKKFKSIATICMNKEEISSSRQTELFAESCYHF